MKNRLWQKIQLGIVGVALVTTFTACGPAKKLLNKLFGDTGVEPFTHTVRCPNESLQIIADWYTGDKENWKALARANPHIDPYRISIEVEILIPRNLLKRSEPMPFIHTVRWPNEWLSIIANWYTGEVENWKALAKANPHIDPNRIFMGDKILIPRNLLKTCELMPKKFVDPPPGPDKDRKPVPPRPDKIELEPIPPR